MVYKAIGLMSGSSLDGLDIAYVHLQETAGKWNFEIIHTGCDPYPREWIIQLQQATSLGALEYQLLHAAYGHYIGEQVNRFIVGHDLFHKVDLIASHGHTTFHVPSSRMTAQLGDGSAIAAVTRLPVVSDLRAMDIALGGEGAPIVPIGEMLLLPEYDLLLNLGGIANLSAKTKGGYIAFDVCPANRVFNMLAAGVDKEYDEDGKMAAAGMTDERLLTALNGLAYYSLAYPKSLANNFGTDVVYPLIRKFSLSTQDSLRTAVEHVCHQIQRSVSMIVGELNKRGVDSSGYSMLVTGGGALNNFLISRLQEVLRNLDIHVVVPERNLINYKEALIMALMGVLRWRDENNVLSSVTGAERNSIGGAIWMGSEA